jgi:hypothetical protein
MPEDIPRTVSLIVHKCPVGFRISTLQRPKADDFSLILATSFLFYSGDERRYLFPRRLPIPRGACS